MAFRLDWDTVRDWTDDFEVLLGEGGSGLVYDAVVNGGYAVVKVIKSQTTEQVVESSFMHEVGLASGLQHPNIARLQFWAVREEPESDLLQRCVIYERQLLGTLRSMLAIGRNDCELLPVDRLHVVRDAVLGVVRLHSDGVLHGNLSTGNIGVNANVRGEIIGQLLDCGLAKLLAVPDAKDAAGQVGPPFGTPGFMCPRYLAPPHQYSAASEVYSLSVVLLCALCGCDPLARDGMTLGDRFQDTVDTGEQFEEYLDSRTDWSINAENLGFEVDLCFSLIARGTNHYKNRRPSIEEFAKELKTISSAIRPAEPQRKKAQSTASVEAFTISSSIRSSRAESMTSEADGTARLDNFEEEQMLEVAASQLETALPEASLHDASLPDSSISDAPLLEGNFLDGSWSKATIEGDQLTWAVDGQTITLAEKTNSRLKILWKGDVYAGELGPDGKLHWSDGDVWTREEDASLDGAWSKATIRGDQLIRDDGETIRLKEKTHTRLKVVWKGEVLSAELGAGGELCWSDGEVWSRKQECLICLRQSGLAASCANQHSFCVECLDATVAHLTSSGLEGPSGLVSCFEPHCDKTLTHLQMLKAISLSNRHRYMALQREWTQRKVRCPVQHPIGPGESLIPGAIVRIEGLTQDHTLNGQRAYVRGCQAESGLWEVCLARRPLKSQDMKILPQKNLVVVGPGVLLHGGTTLVDSPKDVAVQCVAEICSREAGKHCPTCGAVSVKQRRTDCNAILCEACRQHFCFLCGAILHGDEMHGEFHRHEGSSGVMPHGCCFLWDGDKALRGRQDQSEVPTEVFRHQMERALAIYLGSLDVDLQEEVIGICRGQGLFTHIVVGQYGFHLSFQDQDVDSVATKVSDRATNALCWCADTGNVEAARTLLEQGDAVIDGIGFDEIVMASRRATPLMIAVSREKTDMVALLIEHRANLDARDLQGWTPMMHLFKSGVRDCAPLHLVLDARADVSLQDNCGDTALHLAADALFPEGVKLLLEARASVNKVNGEGRTALQFAISSGLRSSGPECKDRYARVVRCLRKHVRSGC